MTSLLARVRNIFHELLYEQETRADRITLTLLEKTPVGPYWDIKVDGDRDFSLFSDELVLNFGLKRPAIKFTSDGMTTICPKCGGEVSYGFQEKVPNWWCEECGHHKLDERVAAQMSRFFI